ncbi:MAG: hypothetical protein IJ407_01780 [Clostridia bacterium]|nr:hypothetical protein [Clostridia bacterium]
MTIRGILTRAAYLLGAAEGEPGIQLSSEKFLAALDSALGELARTFPTQARCKITLSDGEAELPSNVLIPRGLYREGKRFPLVFSEGKLIGEDGIYTLVYYRVPMKASEMEETQVLPMPEDLTLALPFYCAAVYVMGDDPALYNRLMEQYNTKLAAALGYRPAAGVEGGGSL